MFKNLICISIASILLLFSTGCASGDASKSLPASYPSSAGKWHHGTLDRVEFVKPIKLSDYDKVLVEDVNRQGVLMPSKDSNTYAPVEEALTQSTNYIANGIRAGSKNALPVETRTSTGGRALIVRAKVLSMDPGSQAARYWGGFGAGKAETRVGGDIVDGSTGQTVLRFEDSKTSSGGMFGGSYSGLLEGELTGVGKAVGVLIGAYGTGK